MTEIQNSKQTEYPRDAELVIGMFRSLGVWNFDIICNLGIVI
jgi:hypothetical protein